MKKKFMSTSIKIFLLILILLTIVFYSSGCIILVNSGYKLSDYADEINLNDFNFYYSDELGFNYKTSEKSYPINNNIKNIEISLESQNINVNEYDGIVINPASMSFIIEKNLLSSIFDIINQ